MAKSCCTQHIWIQRLLLYASLFHVFMILLPYAIYNLYLSLKIGFTHDIQCAYLVYGIFALWVSFMFLVFMIQGLRIPNKYHLHCGVTSMALLTAYMFWWQFCVYVRSKKHPSESVSIKIICYVNSAFCLIYLLFSALFISIGTSQKQPTNNETKRQTTLTSSDDIYKKCVPMLLFDNEISTIYFVSCIYECLTRKYKKQYYNSDVIACLVFLTVQWIILYLGYKVMKQKDHKYNLWLLIAYVILLIVGFIPETYVYQNLLKLGPFFLLPLFVLLSRTVTIYCLYRSYKYFKRRTNDTIQNTVVSNDETKGNPKHPSQKENMSTDSNNAFQHYIVPNPIETIRQLSASKSHSRSCKDDICHSKHNNIHKLIKNVHEWEKENFFNKGSNSFWSSVGSSEMKIHLNKLYENDGTFMTSSGSSKSNHDLGVELSWDHYLEFHKNALRKNMCQLLTVCPWSEHMQQKKDKNEPKHRLLQFCTTRKQVLHVYFYHCQDYDMISSDKSRNGRYVEESQSKIRTLNRESTVMTTMAEINTNAHCAPIPMFTNLSTETRMTETENEIGEDEFEPGVTPYDNHILMHMNESNSNVLTIRMTSFENDNDECINNDECKMLQQLLEYGSGANCNKPDIESASVSIDENEETNIDSFENKNEKYIKLYLHCITTHTQYKIECTDKSVCEYKIWTDNSQQTMRQMIHSEFYKHRESIEIVMNNQTEQPSIIGKKPQKSKTLSSVLVDNDSTSETAEKEQKYENESEPLQISYIPTMLSIIKSQNIPETNELSKTKSKSVMDENLHILQFGVPFEEKEPKFDNPKEEILRNSFKPLSVREWNDLLRKCVGLSKTTKAKCSKLTMKQLVSLKLYTDFDDLQRELRKCFRNSKHQKERQRQFFHWNNLLEIACLQSTDIITSRLYHGINKQLMPSSFSGTYYGPISTTTMFDIAKQFAGNNGRILELYPSYSRRGLRVSWLSNFPDEDEVLYMNASFQIINIYTNNNRHSVYRSPFDPMHQMQEYEYYTDEEDATLSSSIGNLPPKMHHLKEKLSRPKSITEQKTNTMRNLQNISENAHETEYNTLSFERSIMKAIQTINVNSSIISFNSTEIKMDHSDSDIDQNPYDSRFNALNSDEQIAVLYLLYLQYKKSKWAEFLQSSNARNHGRNLAIGKYRDQFITLANNVKAVKLERASKIIQQFFANAHSQNYKFPTQQLSKDGNNSAHSHRKSIFKILINDHSNEKKKNAQKYILNFSIFVKLFPHCKQLMMNGDNFDWSLKEIISFLSQYNLDFSKIALYDIYIRFGEDYENISNSERKAKQRIKESRLSSKDLQKLRGLGWQFVKGTRCHLHRYGFKPHPSLPFLSLFVDKAEDGSNKPKSKTKFTVNDILSLTYSKSKSKTKSTHKSRYALRKSMTDKSRKSNQSGKSVLYNRSRTNSTQNNNGKSPVQSSIYSEGLTEFAALKLAWSRTGSMRSLHSSTHSSGSNNNEGLEITIVAYNDTVCDLSMNVFYKMKLEYQNEICNLLRHICVKEDTHLTCENQKLLIKFQRLCKKIKRLVLDPMPRELNKIFLSPNHQKISFDSIMKIFPNCEDIFLRDTRFTLRVWYNLLKTLKKYENVSPGSVNHSLNCKLNRIFFSQKFVKNKYQKSKNNNSNSNSDSDYLKAMKLRLAPHGWMFEANEQVLFTNK